MLVAVLSVPVCSHGIARDNGAVVSIVDAALLHSAGTVSVTTLEFVHVHTVKYFKTISPPLQYTSNQSVVPLAFLLYIRITK